MKTLEILFRLEFVLSQYVVYPPEYWPELQDKQVVKKLIANTSLNDIRLEAPDLFSQYEQCLAGFDPKLPLRSIRALAESGAYSICYARDFLNARYPKKVKHFTKLHDDIWQREIEGDEAWQIKLENAEFEDAHGKASGIIDSGDVSLANYDVDDASFPWDNAQLMPVM